MHPDPRKANPRSPMSALAFSNRCTIRGFLQRPCTSTASGEASCGAVTDQRRAPHPYGNTCTATFVSYDEEDSCLHAGRELPAQRYCYRCHSRCGERVNGALATRLGARFASGCAARRTVFCSRSRSARHSSQLSGMIARLLGRGSRPGQIGKQRVEAVSDH
jgi:hypothetical protein